VAAGIGLVLYFVGAGASHLHVGDVKGIGPAVFMLGARGGGARHAHSFIEVRHSELNYLSLLRIRSCPFEPVQGPDVSRLFQWIGRLWKDIREADRGARGEKDAILPAALSVIFRVRRSKGKCAAERRRSAKGFAWQISGERVQGLRTGSCRKGIQLRNRIVCAAEDQPLTHGQPR